MRDAVRNKTCSKVVWWRGAVRLPKILASTYLSAAQGPRRTARRPRRSAAAGCSLAGTSAGTIIMLHQQNQEYQQFWNCSTASHLFRALWVALGSERYVCVSNHGMGEACACRAARGDLDIVMDRGRSIAMITRLSPPPGVLCCTNECVVGESGTATCSRMIPA